MYVGWAGAAPRALVQGPASSQRLWFLICAVQRTLLAAALSVPILLHTQCHGM